MDWSDYLRRLKKRNDLEKPLPIEKFEDQEPALVTTTSLLASGVIASRVLKIIAQRGGARLSPQELEKLHDTLASSLPTEVGNLCEDEAARILDWIDNAERVSADESIEHTEELPAGARRETEVMFEADVETRVSVAEFAIEDGFDLELEYFDEYTDTWPRLRGTPRSLNRREDVEAELVLQVGEKDFEIPFRHIRWLMPVRHRESSQGQMGEKSEAEVIQFPTENDDENEDG